MGSKKSSFHMGDEFNGKGDKVHLRAASYRTYEPLSQENVQLTPDFSQCVPMALGAVPLVVGAGGGSTGTAAKAAGALAAAGQVTVQRGSGEGEYLTSFRISRKRLTNGAYLHQSKQKKDKGAELQI